MPYSYDLQLSVMQAIHAARPQFLDLFFKLFIFVDALAFSFLLTMAVWAGYNWKSGVRLMYILSIGVLFNFFLKDLFELPRPSQIIPSLELTIANLRSTDYGFPSGSAQIAVLLPAILMNAFKDMWAKILGISFFVLLSFSRVYVGAHFFTDIIAGWIVGYCFWIVYKYLFPKIEAFLNLRSYKEIVFLALLLGLVIIFSRFTKQSLELGVVTTSASLSVILWLQLKNEILPPKNVAVFLARATIGCLGMIVTFLMGYYLPIENPWVKRVVIYTLLGIWSGFMANFIITLFFPYRNTDLSS